MNENEEKELVGKRVQAYKELYEKMEFVSGEDARVSATNCLMIRLERDGVFSTQTKSGYIQGPPLPPRKESPAEKWTTPQEQDVCPKCGNADIWHQKKDKPGKYKGCKMCKIFINRDGSTSPMGRPPQKE